MPLVELVGGPEDGQRIAMDQTKNYITVPVHSSRGYVHKIDPTYRTVTKPALGFYKVRCDSDGNRVESDSHTLFDWDGVL